MVERQDSTDNCLNSQAIVLGITGRTRHSRTPSKENAEENYPDRPLQGRARDEHVVFAAERV